MYKPCRAALFTPDIGEYGRSRLPSARLSPAQVNAAMVYHKATYSPKFLRRKMVTSAWTPMSSSTPQRSATIGSWNSSASNPKLYPISSDMEPVTRKRSQPYNATHPSLSAAMRRPHRCGTMYLFCVCLGVVFVLLFLFLLCFGCLWLFV